MKADEEFLKERQMEVEADMKRLNEQYMMLKNSIAQTETESQRIPLKRPRWRRR